MLANHWPKPLLLARWSTLQRYVDQVLWHLCRAWSLGDALFSNDRGPSRGHRAGAASSWLRLWGGRTPSIHRVWL